MSIIFISHDLSLVSEIATKVVVMYKGEIVEKGKAEDVFKNPKHKYTQALLKSKPPLNVKYNRLPTIQDVLTETLNLKTITKTKREEHLKKL